MEFLVVAIAFIAVAAATLYYLFVVQKTVKDVTSKRKRNNESEQPSRIEEKQPKKTKEQPKKAQQGKTPHPMESAERYVNVGNTCPTSISFEPTGQYFIVACKNRQQVLFEVAGIETNSPGKQRYRLTDDTVVDCALFKNASNSVEVALALDRTKSIQSFVLTLNSNKFDPGCINIKDAGKLTVDKIKVAQDLSFVAALGDETYVRVFQPNGHSLFAKDTSQMRNTEITVSSNSEIVAASSYTSEIVAYGVDRDRSDVPTKVSKAFTFSGHKNSIQTIDFDLKQLFIASGGKDCKYNLWLAPTRWREGDIARLQWSGSLNEPIFMVRLCPTDQLIACLTETGKIVFVAKDGIKKTVDVAHNAGATHMEWEPNGKWIVVASQSSPFIYAYANPLH